MRRKEAMTKKEERTISLSWDELEALLTAAEAYYGNDELRECCGTPRGLKSAMLKIKKEKGI